jgi:hypothetical protein
MKTQYLIYQLDGSEGQDFQVGGVYDSHIDAVAALHDYFKLLKQLRDLKQAKIDKNAVDALMKHYDMIYELEKVIIQEGFVANSYGDRFKIETVYSETI